MFPLNQKEWPLTADELAVALESGLGRIVSSPGKMVSVRDANYPNLDEITIDLNDGQIVGWDRLKPPPVIPMESVPVVTAGRLLVDASRLSIGDAILNLNLEARDVAFSKGQTPTGEMVMVPHGASQGRMQFSIRQEDLATVIRQIATTEAAKRDITIEDLDLAIKLSGPRSLEIKVEVTARKMFFRAAIEIEGKLSIDDRLVARIFDLNCRGDGALATLACNVLAPSLQKLDGREFELTALPLGELRLHDIRLAVDDEVRIAADLGTRAS